MIDRLGLTGSATSGAGLRKGSTTPRTVERVSLSDDAIGRRPKRDWLATEEPLEIRVELPDGTTSPVSVTMRTPGSDFELAAGFMYGEAIVDAAASIVSIRYCVDARREGPQQYNAVTVRLAPGARFDPATLQRNFYTSSSCGVCGKASIEAVLAPACDRIVDPVALRADLLPLLPLRLREAQAVFDRTGGLHAAALFTAGGELLRVREDVGRHNALDKLIGWAVLQGRVPLDDALLLVSGRSSYEIIQKAITAGVSVVCGISAPSSLAVTLAEHFGVTLVGFLRDRRCNVYAHAGRIVADEPVVTGD